MENHNRYWSICNRKATFKLMMLDSEGEAACIMNRHLYLLPPTHCLTIGQRSRKLTKRQFCCIMIQAWTFPSSGDWGGGDKIEMVLKIIKQQQTAPDWASEVQRGVCVCFVIWNNIWYLLIWQFTDSTAVYQVFNSIYLYVVDIFFRSTGQ